MVAEPWKPHGPLSWHTRLLNPYPNGFPGTDTEQASPWGNIGGVQSIYPCGELPACSRKIGAQGIARQRRAFTAGVPDNIHPDFQPA